MSSSEPPLIAEEREEAALAGRPVAQRRRTYVTGDPAFRMVQTIWLLLGVVEAIIGLRVLFRAAAAVATGVVSFIYAVSGPLIAPFRGITPDYATRGNVVEIGSIIAMIVYLIAAVLVVRLVRIATAPRGDAYTGGATSYERTRYQ
jgi:YGGT family